MNIFCGTQVSYLGTAWSVLVLLYLLLVSIFILELIIPHNWAKPLLYNLKALRNMRFYNMTGTDVVDSNVSTGT